MTERTDRKRVIVLPESRELPSSKEVANQQEHSYSSQPPSREFGGSRVVDTRIPELKELIHEEFGDGIMSAINFRLTVTREPDPEGDRVIVTFDGKFLDYRW